MKYNTAWTRILTIVLVLLVASIVCISPISADDIAEIDDSIPPETPTSLPPPEEPTSPAPTESSIPLMGTHLGLAGVALVLRKR